MSSWPNIYKTEESYHNQVLEKTILSMGRPTVVNNNHQIANLIKNKEFLFIIDVIPIF